MTGAMQFVIQDAFDTHWTSGVMNSSLTPKTIIASISSLAGTVRITFFAPFLRWSPYPPFALSFTLKIPVASTTTSGVIFHGMFAGFRSALTLISTPSTIIALSLYDMFLSNFPWVES